MRALAVAAGGVAFLVLLSPLAVALLGSLLPEDRLFAGSLLEWTPPVLDHYRAVFRERGLLIPLRNSLVVAAGTTLLCLAVGAGCAYALARLDWRGRSGVLACVLATTLFPQISLVSPLYLLLRSLVEPCLPDGYGKGGSYLHGDSDVICRKGLGLRRFQDQRAYQFRLDVQWHCYVGAHAILE